MKKSSLKKYITLLEAAADSATHARDYWMREHERRVEELLEADNKIAELKVDSAANASAYWVRQHELREEELLEAKNHIAELERMLDDNGGPCALRVKLTAETCGQTIKRLWKDKERLREDNERLREDNERLREDNERLLEASPTHQHNHTFERDNNDTQA